MEKSNYEKNNKILKKHEINVDDIWDMIETIHLQNQYTKEQAQAIFEEIDQHKNGKILTEQFINYITKLDRDRASNFERFFEIVGKELITPSEKIIAKLKKLKQKNYIQEDIESLSDIDWIISSIISSDLFDIDYQPLIKKKESISLSNIDGAFDYISQYSQIGEHARKIHDLQKTLEKKLSLSPSRINNDDSSSSGEEMKKMCLDFTTSPNAGNTIIEENSENSVQRKKSITHENIQVINQILLNINSFDFNIFELDQVAERQTLFYLSNEIFSSFDYFEKHSIDLILFRNLINDVANGYDRNNPYHNDLHGADVLHTSFMMINNTKFQDKMSFNDIDIISLLIAALSHDFRHPDASVLENFHVSEFFKLLRKEENNILENFTPEESRILRRRIIECVLSTDMSNHSKIISNFKNKLETFDVNNGNNLDKMIFFDNLAKTFENQQTILNLIIHTADISNPLKPPKINKVWVDFLFVEYFNQGDSERALNLPITPLCNRYTTDINQSQIFFIDCIVMPTFEILLKVNPLIEIYYKNLKENRARYEDLVKKR